MLDKNFLLELQQYIEKRLSRLDFCMRESTYSCERVILKSIRNSELEEFINSKRRQTFSQLLFGFIDKKGVSDSEIYKKAGIDRRHFSKIRSNSDYTPGKNTVIALSLALELNKNEMDSLLSAAGYSLSDNDTLDLIIQFCLEKKIYDINSINEALDYFSLKPLAGVLE